MRHVLRDSDGSIVSVHREPVPGSQALSENHPDVQAFLMEGAEGPSFAGLDADLVRVLEDLIDALIERNVLRITDLPGEAQQKLFNRKHFRSRVQAKSLRLFGTEQDGLGQDQPAEDSVVSSDLMGLIDLPGSPSS
ncbi:MAG TPA: hypothetical protein PKV17_00720 [Aquabacterium sp.]|nr:hypothetical protein [Aquabacterium sp.]HRH27285.1 hypothetical protein [Aquabacterium sp.]